MCFTILMALMSQRLWNIRMFVGTPRFNEVPLFFSELQIVTQSWAPKMASMLKGDLLYIENSARGYFSFLVSGVSSGGGAAGCNDLRTPQAPSQAVPDAQMGQTANLSASRAEEANSLIWSLLMESLEGASPLTCLWLPFSPLPRFLIESFHWCLWQNKVPLGKEREREREREGDSARGWERETKNKP